MFRGIVNNYDSLQLQSDIDRLATRSSTWRLLFNPNKYKIMTVGRAKSTSYYTMTLYNGSFTSLERSKLEKDLGILTDCQLNFSEHYVCGSKES